MKQLEHPDEDQSRFSQLSSTGRPAQSELGILDAVVTGNFFHKHHDPAPHGGIVNSHERSDQP